MPKIFYYIFYTIKYYLQGDPWKEALGFSKYIVYGFIKNKKEK